MSSSGSNAERRVRHVVHDADREVVARLLFRELVEDAGDHGRGEFLGGQAVPAADDPREGGAPARFGERGHDILIERLADRAGLLGAVEDGDRADGRRQRGHEAGDVERAEEPDLENADLFAAGHQPVDGFVGGLGARAHEDDDALGLRVAGVVEREYRRPVIPAKRSMVFATMSGQAR